MQVPSAEALSQVKSYSGYGVAYYDVFVSATKCVMALKGCTPREGTDCARRLRNGERCLFCISLSG